MKDKPIHDTHANIAKATTILNSTNIVRPIKKLYKVVLKEWAYSSNNMQFRISYVVAEDSDKAYLKVKDYLELKNFGDSVCRELETITLMAASNAHNNIGIMLYL